MDITVRPVAADEIDRVPLRCWPDRETIARLFDRQGTIGMAAWEQDKCVGQLHCYRIAEPSDLWEIWPDWSRRWWIENVRRGECRLQTPAWCHACCHVGRTLDTLHDELLQHVLRLAQRAKWNADAIYADIRKLDAVFLSRAEVKHMVEELQESGRRRFTTEAPQYRGQGIGTAMCRESIRWARGHDYAAVVAGGVPSGIPEAAAHAGALPWTTYARLGFRDQLAQLVDTHHPPVRQAKESALQAGRSHEDICDRMMVLDLKGTQQMDPGDKR